MVSQNKKTYILMIFTVLLLVNSFATVSAQNDEIVFPEFKVETSEFNTNDRNDLYLMSENYHAMFPHSMKFTGDMANQYDYFEEGQPSSEGARNQGVAFMDDNPGIMQFLNGTLTAQTLQYRRSYFSLLDIEGEGSQIQITANQVYAFSIDVEEAKPMFIKILAGTVGGAGAGNTFQLTTSVLNSEGNVENNQIGLTEGIMGYIPFMPNEPGTYIFTIQSDENLILDLFDLEENPEIVDVQRSYSEHFDGDETIARFIKFNTSEVGSAIWDIRSIVYAAQYFIEAVTYVQPGDLRMYLFDGNSNQLLSNDVGTVDTSFYSAEVPYVAIVVSPPNEKDPDMRRAIQEGIIDGIDIDLILSAQRFPVADLPLDQNFETLVEYAYEQAGTKFYFFSPDELTLMSVNSSTTNSAMTFTSLNPDNPGVVMSNTTHNARYVEDQNIGVFAPGDYYVELPTDNEYHFSTFIPETFNTGESKSLTQTYGDIVFYYLPVDEYTDDLVNITYPDQLNQSATYDLEYYDIDGSDGWDIEETFSHYYDNTTMGYIINNNTEFDSLIIDVNIQGVYLKVTQISNSHYNTTGWEDQTDDTSLSATLQLERLNDIQVQEQNDDTVDYYINQLSEGSPVSHFLNGSIATITDYLTIETSENSAYRITIDTVNMTLADYLLYSTNSEEWTSIGSYQNAIVTSYTANVSGVIHNYYEIQFTTTLPLTFGLLVDYNTAGPDNGTTSISLETLEVLEFTSLNVTSLNEFSIGEEGDQGFDWGTALLIGGGVVAGVGIIAAIVLLLRRRGLLGGSTY